MKKVLFVIPGLWGGGAEHVASVLANAFSEKGIATSIVLTSQRSSGIIKNELRPEIELISLRDEHYGRRKPAAVALRLLSSAVCRFIELFRRPVPSFWAYLSFWSEYHRELEGLRRLLSERPDTTVIAFLQPAIPITLLAARGLPNRVIFSERGNPARLMKNRYGRRFIERYYTRADAAVFQTREAAEIYPPAIAEKGTVIPNPLPEDLPAPYHGERKHCITTFCRISAQKNLPLLLEAFRLVHHDHPEYNLRIIGSPGSEKGRNLEKQLRSFVKGNELDGAVVFEPSREDVLPAVIRDAMYVNSSDYEGISNAMLEAMAIGMPVICTDCPIGGARSVIQNGVNGILVPVGDIQALSEAMIRLIEEPELTEKFAFYNSKLREELSLKSISSKWLSVLGISHGSLQG